MQKKHKFYTIKEATAQMLMQQFPGRFREIKRGKMRLRLKDFFILVAFAALGYFISDLGQGFTLGVLTVATYFIISEVIGIFAENAEEYDLVDFSVEKIAVKASKADTSAEV